MNGEFLRGEIYWVRDALTNGSEEAFRRPFVVVSSNQHNKRRGSILGASLTTKQKNDKESVHTKATGRNSWILCDTMVQIDKSRLMEYYGKITPEEMREVEAAVSSILDLPCESNKGDESLRMERDMFQKLYERTLEELYALKTKQKLSENSDSKPEVAKKVEVVKVNINTATAEAISAMLEIPMYEAYVITGYRRVNGDFVDIEELRDVAELPKDFVEKYGDKITIGEENEGKRNQTKSNETEIKTKVNVNTATPEEMHEKLGMGLNICQRVRAYRNKNGPFKKVEDLLNVDRFGSGCMKIYGHLLEV